MDKNGTIKTEEAGSPVYTQPRGFGGKLKNHCKRFWWLHLIIFIIGVLVVTLPLYESNSFSRHISSARLISSLIALFPFRHEHV